MLQAVDIDCLVGLAAAHTASSGWYRASATICWPAARQARERALVRALYLERERTLYTAVPEPRRPPLARLRSAVEEAVARASPSFRPAYRQPDSMGLN